MTGFGMPRKKIAYALASSIFTMLCAVTMAAVPGPAQQGLDFGGEDSEKAARSALAEVQSISEGIQSLKSQVVELNKDLRLMEEKLLFPSNTRYSFFVSLSSDRFFQLEGVKLKIDGELVAAHVYSDKQRQALVRGGVHRLYVTNMNEGQHTATVFFTGLGSNRRPYKRAVSLDFDKGPGSGYLEISVSDDLLGQEPAFRLRQW